MLFYKDQVLPKWQKYSKLLEDPAASHQKLRDEFPFALSKEIDTIMDGED